MAPHVAAASAADAPAIGRLLDAFNREYDEATPGADALAARVAELLARDDFAALLAHESDTGGPVGLAVLRLRPSLWSTGLECYLAELYVIPERRGHGLGRALLEAAMDHARHAGADHMDLGTSHDDVAARGLYEACGFTNREHPPDGAIMYVYEREL